MTPVQRPITPFSSHLHRTRATSGLGNFPFGESQAKEELSVLFGGRRIDLFPAEWLPQNTRDRIIAEAELVYPERKPGR